MLPIHRFIILVKIFIIAETVLHTEQLKEHFVGRDRFSISDIIEFYRKFEESVKRSTIDWRIYELKNRGVLQRIGRGSYSLNVGEVYTPQVAESERKLYISLKKEFPFLDICIWNSMWLNEFMIHQPGRFYTLIEVEKDAMESVFYFLQSKSNKVFMDPSESLLARYAQSKDNIIVTNLVTEAPTHKIDKVVSSTLEKMLVDIFCNEVIFSAQQGQEMKVIFQTAFNKYIVDQAKMMRYAGRRRKRQELQNYVYSILTEEND